MNRRSFPVWLLRDVPAFLGFLCSFWPLMIFVITSGGKAARKGKASRNIYDRIAILLAHAESRLDFALWRQAYRRLGWSARHVAFTSILPPDSWAATVARYRAYSHACRGMDNVVDTYVEHLREQYRIRKAELVAHGSTDASLRAAAHHELVGAASIFSRRAQFALILSSARSSRPSKDERGHAHARGPPPFISSNTTTQPTSQAPLRDRSVMRALTFPATSTTYAPPLEPTHMQLSKPA
jgi:hypothetical protein